MQRIASILLFMLFLVCAPLASIADEKIGVVLMHGTQGTSGPKSPLGPLLRAFRKAGILYTAPDMPWSRRRHLSKTVEESLLEIYKAVERLKAKGATKIVVGGQSLGATAAMAYGGHKKGLTGILVISPGHIPSKSGWQKRMGYDYLRAEKLIKQGKGKVRTKFKSAGKRVFTFTTTPEIYFSWYEPNGPTNYKANAEKMEPGTALFWIQGKDDKINTHGEFLAFYYAPEHPKSKYVVVRGGHLATPRIGAKQIVEWLKLL